MIRTLKRVKLKGRIDSVVREQYIRDDVPCRSPLCGVCLFENQVPKLMQLEKDATHYAIPCLDVVEKYLEILELQEIKGLIILQSIVSKVMQSSGIRYCNRLVNICKDIRCGSIIFLNEVCKQTHFSRLSSDSLQEWLMKCCIKCAEYYAEHLNKKIDIVLISEETERCKQYAKNDIVQIYSLKEYLEVMWPGLDSAVQLYESLYLTHSVGSVKDLTKSYDNYLPQEILEAGVKSGRFYKGHLHVNKHNASQEAFVAASKSFTKDTGDIFIHGLLARNRAIHGDEVVVEMLPQDQWKSRCLNVVDNQYDSKGNGVENTNTLSSVIPTGKVVGILERCWRHYVASLPEEEEDSSSASRKGERVLAVPYDYRIPKIRIVTKQADSIRNQRIIVRIDNWDKDSQYPNGHLVQAVGEIGSLETEVQSLLIEHCLLVGEFPQNLLSELPAPSESHLWKLDENEILKRRDLRSSHLIFSIDPKGCEDVDDALSVRELPDGLIELGVHIADVTHFVEAFSVVDLEAKSRSTTVYLPDRRYDMLPHVLSGNLCSLLGNVDRYAVSVLWELNSKCKVQNVWYGRSVIKSKYKLCYEVAQSILCNHDSDKIICDTPELQGLNQFELSAKFAELKNAISKLHYIASNLRKERLNAGGLELSSINMKFEIDKMLPSVISGIKSSKELTVHKVVAECMIFANHWVAKKISESFPHQALLRRHPNPREADLMELQKLCKSKGFTLHIESNKDLAASLEKAVDTHDPTVNQVFRILATQAMNQATYFCTGNFSLLDFYHYGLGLDKYTHFTSPIRRYADILVHRLLLAAVNETKSDALVEAAEMEELCHHLNTKHKAAQDLEKAAQQLFLAFFIEETFCKGDSALCLVDGIIYSLLTNGMLVFVPKYGIKGAICLCNKDKKVAVVNEDVQWDDGHLEVFESSLSVHSKGIIQKYNIFDHVTLSLKVVKSRSHQPRIMFELVKNEPYRADLIEVTAEDIEGSSLEREEEIAAKEEERENFISYEDEKFSMYLFLQKIKMLSLSDSVQ